MASPLHPVNQRRATVLLAGQAVPAAAIRSGPEAFQEVLARAKTQFGSALCQCKRSPLRLVIRERNNKLHLACWPDQAQEHALDCPFYSIEGQGGRAAYDQGAITPDGNDTKIKLHHAVVQKRTEASRNSEAKSRSRLHIWGLLHHLWECAGLNRWYPGWTRDWGMVRYVLRRAAQTTTVDNEPLLPFLYVPPPWSHKRRDAIAQQWSQFKHPLITNHRGTNTVFSGFIIGSIKSMEKTPYGFAIRMHHMGEPIYIDEATSARLASYSRKGWAAARLLDTTSQKAGPADTTAHVIAALRVQASASRTLVAIEGAMMRVSKAWIPVSSSYEEAMADALVEGDRRFVRPLHYDIHHLDQPHFVLTDCADPQGRDPLPRKVAMFVYGKGIDEAYQAKIERNDADLAQRLGYGMCSWNTKTSSAPSLPPVHPSVTAEHRASPPQPSDTSAAAVI